MTMLHCVLLTSLLVLAACGPTPECGPNASCVAPHLYVDACREPQRELGGEVIGGTEDCGLDFGVLDDRARTRKLRLTNAAIVDVSFTLAIDGQRDDAPLVFSLEDAPTTIGPGFATDAVVRVEPRALGAATATLRIDSDAVNTLPDGDGVFEIALRASALQIR